MTPAELNLYARAYVRRREDEERICQANIYSLASLIRTMVWAKHPPRFEKVFPEKKRKREPMTDEEMYARVVALNRLFGGEEVE